MKKTKELTGHKEIRIDAKGDWNKHMTTCLLALTETDKICLSAAGKAIDDAANIANFLLRKKQCSEIIDISLHEEQAKSRDSEQNRRISIMKFYLKK